MHDLRIAFRTLFRTPFVTGVAVLTLALGIGANAAIFSLFDQALLQSLPVREPERLVNLTAPGPPLGSLSSGMAGERTAVFSYPMFRDLERGETGLAGIAAHRSFEVNLAFEGRTLNGTGMLVSGAYFPLLGVQPALGRLLRPSDDATSGAHFVAVLGHDYWQAHLGADLEVVGKTVVVNGQQMAIVGVAPRGFAGTTLGVEPDVYVPISMSGAVAPWFGGPADRRSAWVYLFGRLPAGATVERAQAAINAVYRPIIEEVEVPLWSGVGERWLTQLRAKRIVLEPGHRGQSRVHGKARTPLVLLFGITGFVLLIACANIANLLLARGAGRGMEMAVRLSLGASRRQLVTQLLTESCVLALLGGAASLLVAQWTLALVASMLPPEAAAMLRLELRPAVALFAAALSLGTGLLFGLFPALHGTRTELVAAIRANAGHVTGARAAGRFRSTLVTAQVALAMALLVSAGLFLRSLVNISRIDLGVRADGVVTFAVSPGLNGYEPERSRILFERMGEELAALPGVSGVTAARFPILTGSGSGHNVSVEGFERGPDADAIAGHNAVGPAYFRTMGTPLLTGRAFTVADDAGRPRVAIVNEAFARKFGLGRNPIGKRMALGSTRQLDIEIVGLVGDTKYDEVKTAAPPIFYTPYRQGGGIGGLTFYVRAQGDPAEVLRAVPGVVARLDPNLPVENLKTLPQQVRENVSQDRLIGILAAVFAALATLLAAVGLYGVLAYAVAQRTREIGVRIALGADGRRVRAMVLRQVGRMMLVGGPIGIAAALGLGSIAGSLLYGLDGYDPAVVGLAALVLGLVALAAGYIPARRASRVDPVRALKYE